jgi:hypothetical protein
MLNQKDDMQTKAGTYIRTGRKIFPCECCGNPIGTRHTAFIRVTEARLYSYDTKGNKYKRLFYKRWHILCAIKSIKNLSKLELQLIESFKSTHKWLQHSLDSMLTTKNVSING